MPELFFFTFKLFISCFNIAMQNPINIGYFTTTHIQNLKNNRDKYYMMTIGLILVMQVFLMSMITIDMVCHIRKYKIKKLR